MDNVFLWIVGAAGLIGPAFANNPAQYAPAIVVAGIIFLLGFVKGAKPGGPAGNEDD